MCSAVGFKPGHSYGTAILRASCLVRHFVLEVLCQLYCQVAISGGGPGNQVVLLASTFANSWGGQDMSIDRGMNIQLRLKLKGRDPQLWEFSGGPLFGTFLLWTQTVGSSFIQLR